ATFDSLPIALQRAPLGAPGASGQDGALLLQAALPGTTETFPMLLDTGTPITVLGADRAAGTLTTFKGDFDLRDDSTGTNALRARLRNYDLIQLPLHAVGEDGVVPNALLGGDLLRGFSVDLRFGAPCPDDPLRRCASVTFWRHQNAERAFLQDAGYAVVGFSLFCGGAETEQWY